MILDAWSWCTGMTQRAGMGREVGGGFRMGNTCTSMVGSCQCMAKPIQYCKVINLQLKETVIFKIIIKNDHHNKSNNHLSPYIHIIAIDDVSLDCTFHTNGSFILHL